MGLIVSGGIPEPASVDNNQIGERALLQPSPAGQAESLGRHECHFIDGVGEREASPLSGELRENPGKGAEGAGM